MDMNMKHMLTYRNKDAERKIIKLSIIGNCSRNMSSLQFMKEKETKKLYSHACYEPDLFWRSKCARQGGRSLNERCTIKDSRRIE